MITTDDLIRLGFERMDVSAEESGDMPFYYFEKRYEGGFDLLTLCDNELIDGAWVINHMGDENVWIDNIDDLSNLINILHRIQP